MAATQSAEAPAPEGPGLLRQAWNAVSGADQTPEVAALPELATAGTFLDPSEQGSITTGALGKDAQVAAGLMFAASDEAKKDIIKAQFGEGVKFETKDGVTIANFPDGKRAVLNRPGFSFQDAMGLVGDIALFAGPSRIAGLGRTALQRVGLEAGLAGATEAGRQKAVQALGSEQEVDPLSVGAATVLGGAGRGAGEAVGAKVAKTRAERLGAGVESAQRAAAETAKARKETAATGVEFFQAQKTQDPARLELQAYLATESPSAARAMAALRKQNAQAHKAVADVLDQIAPAGAVETSQGRVRDVAQAAVAAKEAARAEAASPLYKEALKSGAFVPVPETRALIREKLKTLPVDGKIYGTLRKVQTFLAASKKGTGGVGLQRLHGVKMEIDELLDGFGEGSLRNTGKRELMAVKGSLLKEMDQASPAYKAAREAYAAASPEVESLKASVVGRIAGLEDSQLKSVSQRIFDPAEVNPQIVARSREVVESVDPQAWRDIMRTELERRLGSVRADLSGAGETTANIPAQLRGALFPNEKARKVLLAGADPETRKNLVYLDKALSRASMGRGVGSQTALRGNIEKQLNRGALSALRQFARSPLAAASGVGEATARDVKVRTLGALLYDPKWQPRLRDLRRIDPESEQARKAFAGLLGEVQAGVVQNLKDQAVQ
jgi:hypothetical protein